jgi:hypothetical protein
LRAEILARRLRVCIAKHYFDRDIPCQAASDLERCKPSGPVWTREVVSKRDARMPVMASSMRNKSSNVSDIDILITLPVKTHRPPGANPDGLPADETFN